ncbi:CarboxypepD_reg-like domain-containing protein [Maribacter dokdonensis]|uniref:carboxypeptidase-like regulatory domain-containing protein n=1 Tax=Maribacter dokdonensis TaxID=320912 RepID=UPI001B0F4FD6|nr:carboxypeptidase-like regulatory domain-containing protein [Maribacter dokdonensis]CAG2531644.1 CarboxypepD_reg-like domain-containing protein [Maribacter dokdonensis]
MKKVFVLFALVITSLSFAQETSSIKGKILDGEFYNEPLLMASVSLDDATFSTQTNFRGNFEFNDIAPGKHNILIQFMGYEPMRLEVLVKEGEQATILETLYAKSLPMPSSTKVSSASAETETALELAVNKTK